MREFRKLNQQKLLLPNKYLKSFLNEMTEQCVLNKI